MVEKTGDHNGVGRPREPGYWLPAMKTKLVGRYIVTDPKICHGQPTFRGTRILVADVLEQVASGIAWESILEEWRGSITEEAIAEAVRLAR